MSLSTNGGDEAALKPFLSPAEFFAEMKGTIGKNSLYGFVHSGRIKSIRVGRKILIPRSELTDFPAREAA
jgi:excisionase family DNA binding protein